MAGHADHVPDLGQPNGIATLDSSGKVPAGQLPPSAGSGDVVGPASATPDAVPLFADSTGKLLKNGPQPGVANGLATLDASGKVPGGQLPDAPVTSVNTQTGAVVLGAGDVGADPTGTAVATVSAHAALPTAHHARYDDAEAVAAVLTSANVIPQAEAEAGIATTPRVVTAQRMAQAIAAQAGGSVSPGQYLLGSILDYGAEGTVDEEEIQYTRVRLLAGLTVTQMQCYIDNATGGTKDVLMGIYSQTTPSSPTGVPNTRVALTAATAPNEGAFTTLNLTSPYVVPTTGYYWLAWIVESGGGIVQPRLTPGIYPSGFLPVRRQSPGSFTLPVTPSGLSNPASAVIYVSALE